MVNNLSAKTVGAFVRLEFRSQEEPDTQTDTHTQTNCSENINPPKIMELYKSHVPSLYCLHYRHYTNSCFHTFLRPNYHNKLLTGGQRKTHTSCCSPLYFQREKFSKSYRCCSYNRRVFITVVNCSRGQRGVLTVSVLTVVFYKFSRDLTCVSGITIALYPSVNKNPIFYPSCFYNRRKWL